MWKIIHLLKTYAAQWEGLVGKCNYIFVFWVSTSYSFEYWRRNFGKTVRLNLLPIFFLTVLVEEARSFERRVALIEKHNVAIPAFCTPNIPCTEIYVPSVGHHILWPGVVLRRHWGSTLRLHISEPFTVLNGHNFFWMIIQLLKLAHKLCWFVIELREFGLHLYCAGQRLFWCSSETSGELLKSTSTISHLGEGGSIP